MGNGKIMLEARLRREWLVARFRHTKAYSSRTSPRSRIKSELGEYTVSEYVRGYHCPEPPSARRSTFGAAFLSSPHISLPDPELTVAIA